MKRRTVEELQSSYMLKLFDHSGQKAYEWVDTKPIRDELDLSESEFSTVLVRLKERGWAKFSFGESYLTADGLEKVEDLMQKTYAEEELLVLEKIQEMGKDQPDGLVEINKLGQEMPELSYPIATYVNELEVSKRFVGAGMDEFTKILPAGLEFLQNRSNSSSSVSVQHISIGNVSNVGAFAIGNQNHQNVQQAISPDFGNAIEAIAELVKASSISEVDKTEALNDLSTLNRLALEPQSPGIVARALAKISSLETLLKAGEVAAKMGKQIQTLYDFFTGQN